MASQRMGVCTNFGNCSVADKKEKVPIGIDGACPECNSTLNEIPTSTFPLKMVGVVLLLTAGIGGWYLSSSDGKLPSKVGPPPSLSSEEKAIGYSCGPNEIKAPDGECVPKPPSLSELREQVKTLEKRLDEVQGQLGSSDVQALTAKLDWVQQEIEGIQGHIYNTPDSYELNVLQEQLDKQQQRKNQITNMSLADQNRPKCLFLASSDLQKKLPMFLVPAVQQRVIPQELRRWMKNIADSTIDESTFFIMRREVTVSEFQAYVAILNNEQRNNLGDAWQQSAKDNPVASVPWWAAKGYADWLSQQTGCFLTLPTYNQWVAATIRYDADPQKAIVRETPGKKPQQRDEEPSGVVDLLANLREWSIDDQGCDANGHYLLGEDYKTYQDNIIGESICESSTLDTVGFRLVLRE